MTIRIRKPGVQASINRSQHTARRPINRPNTLRVSSIDRLFFTSGKK